MRVSIGRMSGMVDIVMLKGGKVVGSESFFGTTESGFDRKMELSEVPDAIVIDQVGPDTANLYSTAQIYEAFYKWEKYVEKGGAVADTDVMTSEELALGNTEALINFIKGEYK